MTRLLILFLVFFTVGFVQKKAKCQPTGIELPAGIDLLNPGTDPFNDRPWKLIFQDHFTNTTGVPDPAKWSVRNNYVEPAGREDCIYRSQNISVQNGKCIIELKKEPTPYIYNNETYNYSAGNMTAWPVDAKHGMLFQASIKMPKGECYTHSNFWATGDYIMTGGEIDAAEINGDHNGTEMPATIHDFDLCPRIDRHSGGPNVAINNPPAPVTDMFYTYSFIWDKYFIYMYISPDNISHQLIRVFPRLLYSSQNDKSTAYPYYLYDPTNYPNSQMPGTFKTISGYYWINEAFNFFNNPSGLIIHSFLDKDKDCGQVVTGLPAQVGTGQPVQMEIEWVKVYERKPCDLKETITSSQLFPFFDIKAKEINLGTTAGGSTQNSYDWQNIAKRYAIPNEYEAESIMLHPGFISQPEYIDGKFCDGKNIYSASVASYTAKSCLTDITNEYEEGEDPPNYKPGRKSDGSSAIQYFHAKNKSPIDNNIRIYPNPTTGSFHIEIPQSGNYTVRVMNMVGSTVYEGKMADEQKKSILLDNNLPPGNYTLHISGDGLRHIERIALTK